MKIAKTAKTDFSLDSQSFLPITQDSCPCQEITLDALWIPHSFDFLLAKTIKGELSLG